ncbi:MAG: TRAP transporter large permease subunit [Dehalococcoidales bacterium]|nr:TRAP transporter large permease subunit [Dehalococcoidales bacterium]
MTDLNVITITALMFGIMIILLFTGLPIAFGLAITGMLFTMWLWGMGALQLGILKIYYMAWTIVLIAIPLFVLMGCVLERSGIGDDLYKLMHGTIGRLRGGLAVGTIIICTIMAAMTGISGAATVTMGIVALPAMFKRGYDQKLAIGSIAAAGALGILIPPSVSMVVFALFAQESVGRLFAGGVLPGLLLSALYVTYVIVRCQLQPNLAPSVALEERFNFKQTIIASKGIILPFIIIVGVLGSIFTGAATPTEAAAVGATGCILAAFIRGKFSFSLLKESLYNSFRISSFVFWIVAGATLYVAVFTALGGPAFVKATLASMDVNRWVIMIAMQLTIFILGCFIDPLGIVILTTPIYVPILKELGFDIVWYGILFVMNMETSFLTPPFGGNIFYLKGVVPPEITMAQLYNSVWPWVILQILGIVIVMIFPQIALFLPNLLFRPG